jgi:ubiquitin-protein ligase
MSNYSSRTIKRLMSEIKNIEKNREEMESCGLYIYYDESNIGEFYFMIIGTEDTPYEKGFYPFKLVIPSNYPFEPPKVTIILPNDGHSRMNPNLYIGGKVCLSMINTWAGPGWLPSYTIDKVVIAIQALVMNENPLVNEPGHENDTKDVLKAYNRAVLHQNYALGIIRMYQSLNCKPLGIFKDIIINKINENKEFYINKLEKYIEEYKDIPEFRTQTYGMKIKNNYRGMLKFIKEI